jgi:Tfp pilus assembly protein PilW
MECKTTFSRPARPGGRTAFTLVELLVTMGLSSILLIAVASLSLYTGRTFAALTNYVDLDNASRNALDTITSDVRQVRWLNRFSPSNLVFADFDNQDLTYTYNGNAKTLSRIKGGQATVLLRECDTLMFRMYQRNTASNTFDLISTTNVTMCKAIDVSWVCSRQIFGKRVNTESVQTARIIIRKQ